MLKEAGGKIKRTVPFIMPGYLTAIVYPIALLGMLYTPKSQLKTVQACVGSLAFVEEVQ